MVGARRGGGAAGGRGAVPGGGMARKETVLDLARFVDSQVHVKLAGGREVTGILKGYDQLLNLVLDESVEHLRDPADPTRITDASRPLGLTVLRGTAVVNVCPEVGREEIANPFAGAAAE